MRSSHKSRKDPCHEETLTGGRARRSVPDAVRGAGISLVCPTAEHRLHPALEWGLDTNGFWFSWDGTSTDAAYVIEHSGPIPYGMNVVVTAEWMDTRLGATLAPVDWLHTMTLSGPKSFAIKNAACSLRYWSPAYRFVDPGFPPGAWARDWWVPLGVLPPGDYTVTVREFVPRAFPSWVDWDANALLPLFSPVMIPKEDVTGPTISFSVAKQ